MCIPEEVFDRFERTQHKTNKTYNFFVLAVGWAVGIFFVLSIFYIVPIKTSVGHMDLSGILTSMTETPTPTPATTEVIDDGRKRFASVSQFPETGGSVSLVESLSETTPSTVVSLAASNELSQEEDSFLVAGAILITLGLTGPIAAFFIIWASRRINGGDICPSDKFGITILLLGMTFGGMFIAGIMFSSGAETRGHRAIGGILFILVVSTVAILGACTRVHYHAYNEINNDVEMYGI